MLSTGSPKHPNMRYFSTLPKAFVITPIFFLAIACAPTGTTSDPPSLAAGNSVTQIRDQRSHDSFTPDFAIGPGDVLDISVPDVPEINSRTERVSAQNTIDLPIAGEIKVGGLTEDQARDAIRQSLSKLVKDPDVNLFVKEYQSRQVAVVGMVNAPGLYRLNSRSDSVLDLIGHAGGMTERASNVVMLLPASPSNGGQVPKNVLADFREAGQKASQAAVGSKQIAVQAATSAQDPQAATAPDPEGISKVSYSPVPKGADSIPINVTSLTRGSPDDIPVRPGDVIIVPASGSVLVQGWVRNPGAYAITPGLTEYGAITAAGGSMFSSTARLLRMDPSGQRSESKIDLTKIEHGEQADSLVQSGDVVVVNKSAVGAVPYGLYEIFEHFGTGISMGSAAF
jgi:polysaccharide export outer membrane protein